MQLNQLAEMEKGGAGVKRKVKAARKSDLALTKENRIKQFKSEKEEKSEVDEQVSLPK